ncbi:MAG: hypothetical protein IT320_16650 [Anaerolineae bacterium]|nr:hypothetical protein [Anaerolineae bacterium]
MLKKWLGLVCVVCLWICAPDRGNAANVQTIFQQDAGRILLYVKPQDSRVLVLLEPDLTAYTVREDFGLGALQALDLQWIMPLPAHLVVPVGDDVYEWPSSAPYMRDHLNRLDVLTRSHFEPEAPRYCFDTVHYLGRSGDDTTDRDLVAQASAITAVRTTDASTALSQLREARYNITDGDALKIQQLAESGHAFLAVTYHLDSHDDPSAREYTVYGEPLEFSFDWSDESIPLPFAGGTSTTWIFSSQAYRPAAIARAVPDFSRFRAPHTIANTGTEVHYDYAANSFARLTTQQYQGEVRRALAAGGAVTEYAGPTDILGDDETALIPEDRAVYYPYVTRLNVRLPDDVPYPVYEPAPDQPDRSNVVDLSAYVDPLVYWGCSSRTALDETPDAHLLSTHHRVDDLRFDVAHPPDWQFTTLAAPGGTVYAISPETVTLETAIAAATGDPDPDQPPMLLFAEHTFVTDGYAGPVVADQDLVTALNVESRDFQWRQVFLRYDMNQDQGQNRHGVRYGLFASEADWAANGTLYQAMLDYAQSYQYFASADWPHTLFIHSPQGVEPTVSLAIPYPEGWIEGVDGSDIVISGDSAELRLTPVATATADWLAQHYGLTSALPCGQPTPFQTNGREGYLLPASGFLAQTSTGMGGLADSEEALLRMLAALPVACDP